MSEPRQIAVVTDTRALIAAIRTRADECRLSRQAIDELAELAPGHAGRILSQAPGKGIGLGIIWGLVESVGLKIALIESPEAMARIAEYVGSRNESQVRKPSMRSALRIKKKARLERIFNNPEFFKRLGRKGGRARAKVMDGRARQISAIRAARARWKKPKAIIIKARDVTVTQ